MCASHLQFHFRSLPVCCMQWILSVLAMKLQLLFQVSYISISMVTLTLAFKMLLLDIKSADMLIQVVFHIHTLLFHIKRICGPLLELLPLKPTWIPWKIKEGTLLHFVWRPSQSHVFKYINLIKRKSRTPVLSFTHKCSRWTGKHSENDETQLSRDSVILPLDHSSCFWNLGTENWLCRHPFPSRNLKSTSSDLLTNLEGSVHS